MSIDTSVADFRVAWRNALRHPGFTLLVVLTLALGIGINSAVFALLDGVLLRPLPYREPARLAFVWQTLPDHGVYELEPTPFDYRAWHDLKSFERLALAIGDAFTLSSDDNPERVRGARVTASLMPLLGIAPRLGRGFAPAEDDETSTPVAILSEGLWRRRYGADPSAIGRTLRVNGVDHRIVGVMPAGVLLPGPLASSSELWLPARMSTAERVNEIGHNYTIVARLATSATFASASAELEVFTQRMARERPETHHHVGARLVSVDEQTVRGIRPTLLAIGGGVALLLLVACANAATLLMARAAARQRETAVRAALGAGTGRLLGVSIAESVVFVAPATITGLTLAGWTIRAMLPMFAAGLPPGAVVGLDGRVVFFTAAIAVVLSLALGLLVIAHRPRTLVSALRASSRIATGGVSTVRTRSVLVVAQIALAVVLLAAAGLLMDSYVRLSRVSPGFEADRVISFRISLSDNGYTTPARRVAFVNDLRERLEGRGGIIGAAVTSMLPFGGMRGADGVEIEGRPKKPGETIIIDQRHVTPSYFQTMRIPVVRGRSLQSTDDAQAERVVVINRAMAERYFRDENPLAHRVRVTAGLNEGAWFRIVGVVDNVRHIALSREPVPEMYYAYPQAPVGTFTVVARTSSEPASTVPVIRQALSALDSSLPIYDVRSMDERIASSFAQTRGAMLLILVTATLATILALVAIYGSVWYSVTQRIPEIGVRLALGATRASLCTNVIGRAFLLTSVGAAAGVVATWATRPLIAGLLFQPSETDVRTYAGVMLLLFALTGIAAIGPAARAMRVDPVFALRDE